MILKLLIATLLNLSGTVLILNSDAREVRAIGIILLVIGVVLLGEILGTQEKKK